VDVKGDGKVDLICVNSGSDTLSVLTNDGRAGFAIATTLIVGNGPTSVTAADVNGDGKMDLICANQQDGTLSVITNDGNGGFALSSSPSAGNYPYSVTAADVNEDGKVDLICANSGPYMGDTLSVLTNDGKGGFGRACSLVVGSEPFQIAAADLNGDGKVDFICANAGGNTLSVLINTSTFGSLQVNISPSEVVGVGAEWQMDAGAWQTGGTTISNLPVGSHRVSFKTIIGWATPTSQSVNIVNNQTATVTGTYIPLGSLQVTIGPAGVVDAGAQWQMNGGAWENSGTTISNLAAGPDTVSFNTISGWATPTNHSVNIVNNQTATVIGTYIPLGSLQVTMGPAGALDAGALWQVDGGSWQRNASLVPNLTVGSHAVTFNSISDWTPPVSQVVTVTYNQTTMATATYVEQFGSLQLTISPAGAVSAGAQWQVDGGAWQSSGATVAGLTLGSHNVAFLMVPGWGVPLSQIVTIYFNQTTIRMAPYLAAQPAMATAIITNGFVVAVTIADAGIGYTNTPLVYFVGGGGGGAQGVATVSNGVVTGISITNAGSGYSNAPVVAITPPFPLTLDIAPATSIGFTNLGIGTNYQLQLSESGAWDNVSSSFVAGASDYWQYFDGSVNGSLYRLVALPIPYGATANAILDYGFVVAATVNMAGCGYVSVPEVQILGGGGNGAQATATVSNGVVTAINIINAGLGYASTPTIQIDPPPHPVLLPNTSSAFRLDYSGLTPMLNYQLQASFRLTGWTNFGMAFTATSNTNSQYLNFETGSQFFRVSLP
jgi:hypothetical protein